MQVNDLVYIKSQPNNQFVKLEGEYAVVEETFEDEPDYVNIATLNLTGETQGHGTVPVACLDIVTETGPAVWRAALAVYKQNQLQLDQQVEEFREQYEADRKKRRKVLRMVAERHGLEPKALRKILKELEAGGVILLQ